ncbi:hypothetical protein BC936DRAFT_147731 [Jimgerdemannia flammicorona]|uniref:VHS domain-containing protein n=1 Tax=Jimgerdemannia flammicorona TaxID=994334 RepID=A0A433D4K5_9FUNG|nr:hypothetical protein BC936DRAFT_147731 [Jimgerdemannia flammicorona]
MGLFGFSKKIDPNSITGKIEAVVNPKKSAQNPATVDEIAVLVDASETGPEEASKALFKSLKSFKPTKQILALELLTGLADRSEKFRPQLANQTFVDFFYVNATVSWVDVTFKAKIIKAAQHWQNEYKGEESFVPAATLYQNIMSHRR